MFFKFKLWLKANFDFLRNITQPTLASARHTHLFELGP